MSDVTQGRGEQRNGSQGANVGYVFWISGTG